MILNVPIKNCDQTLQDYVYYDSSYQDNSQTQLDQPNQQQQPVVKKKGRGGRKKATRPPSPAILKKRRIAANARERRRMNGLNDAFDRWGFIFLSFFLYCSVELDKKGHQG